MEPKLLTAERFVDRRTGIGYRYVFSETEYFRPHYHDYYEIFILLDGTAMHWVNGEKTKLCPGDVVFIRPADTHDYLPHGGQPFSFLNLTFDATTFDEMAAFLGAGFGTVGLLKASMPPCARLTDAGLDWLEAKMAEIRTTDAADDQTRKTLLRIFLFRLFTRCFADFPEDAAPVMPGWLSDLCAQMKRDGNFIGGAQRMVALSGRTREHVARSVKKYTGLTVSEWVNDLRLRYIADMLRNSNHGISRIILESGFNNESWAASRFKEKYGTTMSRYRHDGEQ